MKKFLENIIHLKEAIYLKLQKLRKKWVILKKRENIYNKLKTFNYLLWENFYLLRNY